MKLCKLMLKNLNSFRGDVNLDFENPPLEDASLVAITGPTGAGKTTLLDAICVALYGKTPRLSGTGSQNPSHLISHGEKDAFAEVHFIANGTRYIAAWSIRGGSSPSVQLRYAEDDKLISDKLSTRGKSLGSSQRTVSEEVESILGLDFDAFKRSVMLAQGEFAAFLKASGEERRKILEATAGIYIYDVLRQALLDKVREVEAANADVLDKLNKIPDASLEQLTEAEAELDRLQAEGDALGTESRQIQKQKERETKRTEDFERLQSSEERQRELTDQQPGIEALQAEKENAERAERLRTEKQAFDNEKLDLEKAEKALHIATTEKTDAEEQVKVDQTDFDKKEGAYQTASTEHKQKTAIYTAAKLDVERAADQFAEANDRTPKLADLDGQTNTLSERLTNSEAERTQLEEQISEAEIFLNENYLPSNRQQRFTDATRFLTQLISQENQLEMALATQMHHEKKIGSLKHEIKALSGIREEQLSKKTKAETTLESATAELNALLKGGAHEEWTVRKQEAIRAQPIAQEYEAAENELTDSEDSLDELNEAKAEVDVELKRIEAELVSQARVCQHAEKAVEQCEETRESALLENPINKLRQHLHTGEPCLVCGAIEHPYAGVVELEDDEMLQNTEDALEYAKTEAQTAQDKMQALKVRQAQTQRDKRNTAEQIEDCESQIEARRNEKAKLLAEWQKIYPNDDVSSEWVAAQIEETDTAIAALAEAEQARTEASHAYEIAGQQLETCENDLARETKALRESEEQLQDARDTVGDFQADIASTEERFWGLLPGAFHGVSPNEAVDQFENKIKEVEVREGELSSAAVKLDLLNAKIETNQSSLGNVRDDHEELQAEIDEYQREGTAFLDVVREKTGGLETEDEIDTAIDALDAMLQSKENERDDAQQQLQESRDLLTGKHATHGIRQTQYGDCGKKFEKARQTYFDKLEDAEFDSPEAHDNAFRDKAQVQELTDRIKAYENEKQRLALEITELRTRFEETPFDPETLGRIEAEAEEIGKQLPAKQEEVGAQGERIKALKDAFKKREDLGSEIDAAKAELMRWKRLYDTIPRNDLRDFALEIMFRQMGSLANEQLKYLTSERYQLKVETIGDLTVIDRWNANEERPVETLSGGESFLTSLALALALADLSRGRAQLNSLFLDEGFGTLDTETLDIAIAALEGLRLQGRSIFLISHVQELTRRLPVKINVRKRGNGISYVQPQG